MSKKGEAINSFVVFNSQIAGSKVFRFD